MKKADSVDTMMKRTKSQSGFSLWELVLVISLLGIMSFTAIPAIINTQAVNIEGASRKLESDMRYAQNLAMKTGDQYGFRTTGAGASGDNTAYEIYEVTTGLAVESPVTHTDMQEDFDPTFSGITFPSQHDIRFDSTGAPTFVQGNGSVSLESDAGDARNIVVNNAGYISIETPAEE